MSTTAVRVGLVAAVRAIRAGRPGIRSSGPETRSSTILSPCHRRPRRDSRPSSAASGWFASASASSAAVAASPASPVDRNDPRFATEVEVLAVRAPRSAVGGLMAKLRRHTLARPRLNRVQHLDDDHSLVLLDTATCPVDGDRDALPPNVLDALNTTCGGGGDEAPTLVTHRVILGYDDLDADECLRRVLPPDVTVPTGFETAGRIAHLNLRDEHEPWKRVIAAVLIDKLPQIDTVVNKTGETGGPFRTFAMEVLAGTGGDGPLETTVSENGLVYAMDFRGMYWNSRLGTERARLVDSFDENDVVLDLCCGVGPIALPASKKCLAVYANDLNPAAVAYLGRNAKRNKGTSLAGVTNLDAGECLRVRIAEFAAAKKKGGSNFDERDLAKMRFTRVVMNLPQGSLTLLPCFVGAFDRETWPPEFLPIVHAYAFSKSDDPESDAGARAAKELGLEEDAAALGDGVGYRRVRLVAPGKHMMLVSFKLPERAAYAER